MAYKKPMPVLIDEKVNYLKNNIQSVLRMGFIYRNCLNCIEWDEGKEECKRFKSRPPATIIVYSCPQWSQAVSDDDIPF